MTNPAILVSLSISAGAALIAASVATAAPLAGPLALRAAAAGEFEQVQYRYRYRYPRSAYRSYAYGFRGYGRRGCVGGDDSTTSAWPSWAVCHSRWNE